MRFSMRHDSTEESERWALSRSTHATVVRPKALVDGLGMGRAVICISCCIGEEGREGGGHCDRHLARVRMRE